MMGRPSRFFSWMRRLRSCAHDSASGLWLLENASFAWLKTCCDALVIEVGGLLRLAAPKSLVKKILDIARASL